MKRSKISLKNCISLNKAPPLNYITLYLKKLNTLPKVRLTQSCKSRIKSGKLSVPCA